jgi:hypothetical protein
MKRRVCLPRSKAPPAIYVGWYKSTIIVNGKRHFCEKTLDIPADQLYRRIEGKAGHGI